MILRRCKWILGCALVLCLSHVGTSWPQDLAFQFHVSANGTSANPNEFGLKPDALVSLDGYDLPQPPPIPGGDLNSFLQMISPPSTFPNRWLRDIRPSANLLSDRVELWPFVVEGVPLGEEFTISIEQVGTIPFPFRLFLVASEGIVAVGSIPGDIALTAVSSPMAFTWELRLEDEVAGAFETWGGIKSLYR